MDWYLKVLRNYVTFSGRARRKEYWMFVLFNIIVSVILGIVDYLLFGGSGMLGIIYSLAILLPSVAVLVRRLHDTNRSGWWVLIILIPIIGSLVLLVFAVLEGEKETNRFGPDPKAELAPESV